MKKQFDPAEHGDMPHFTIQGQLPSLNEYLSACGRNPRLGGRLKKQSMETCSWFIRKDLKGWHTDKPLIIHYVIFEPNMKRDKDNVFCMISKCVCDSLQLCGVIKNDGWKNVVNFSHDFYISRENPRIEVYLEEIKEKENEL